MFVRTHLGVFQHDVCDTKPAERCLHARGLSLTTAKSLLLYTIVKLSVCGRLTVLIPSPFTQCRNLPWDFYTPVIKTAFCIHRIYWGHFKEFRCECSVKRDRANTTATVRSSPCCNSCLTPRLSTNWKGRPPGCCFMKSYCTGSSVTHTYVSGIRHIYVHIHIYLPKTFLIAPVSGGK